VFSLEGSFYRLLSMIYRHVALNLVYCMTCIPLVTIPAATAALFAVARKEVYGEEPSTFVVYFKAFKENIFQASAVGILFFIFAWIWWVDIQGIFHKLLFLGGLFSISMIVVALILISLIIHTYSLMVHTHTSTVRILLNAFKMGMIKPHLTLINLALVCLFCYISYQFPILFFLAFFSLTAKISYWFVDRKFEFIKDYENSSTSA